MDQNTMNREEALEESYQLLLSILLEDGPLDKLESVVDNNVMVYGTAKNEKVHSIDELQSALLLQRKETKGIKYRLNNIPVHKTMIGENAASYICEIMFEVYMPDGKVVLDLRISSIWEWKVDCWKLKHWHASLPTATGDEQDFLHLRKWRQEALELQDKVDQQTIDLLEKNRELEVESALERVRALTMAMNLSEDVGKCISSMFSELTSLGVPKTTRFGIGILNHENIRMELWTASKNEKDEMILDVGFLDMDRHPLLVKVRKAWQDQLSIHTYTLRGKDLKAYFQALEEAPEYTFNINIYNISDPNYHYDFPFRHGIVYAFTHQPLSDELIQIFKKFSSLFGQTYRRYLDLKNAEAQAWEAKIEAALERVRAKSMAMQKSEDLADLSLELVQQVQKLGIDTWFCAFNIQDEHGGVEWGSNGEGVFADYRTPRENIFLEYYKAGQRREALYVREIGEEECPGHYEYLCSLPGVGPQLLQMKEAGFSFPTFQIDHVAFFKYGYILFITFKPVPESHVVFQRFAKVFEQSYTRFLDLKQAESRAQEAKIEAALEKVRSRSLAVQQSEEFNEVVKEVFLKLSEFEISAYSVVILLEVAKHDHWKVYGCGESEAGLITKEFTLPKFNTFLINDLVEKRKVEDIGYFSKVYSEEEKNHYYEYVFHKTELISLPQDIKDRVWASTAYGISNAYRRNSIIMVNDFDGKVLNESQAEILKRFSKVFEQAYIRYLDLQNAEALAREAQIETALERVRSRSMAMQNSDELPEVANILFLQVQALGIPAWSAGYNILSEDSTGVTCIMSSEGVLQSPFYLPFMGEKSFREWKAAVDRGDSFFVQELKGNAIKEHYDYLLSLPGLKEMIAEIAEAGFPLPSYQINHLSFFTHGFLLFITYKEVPEAHDIFKRFTHVFEQTYARFLDLQKAEKQTKRIEAINIENERLLHSILPAQIAEQIRNGQKTVVKRFEEVSILFADIVGFTVLSEKLSPDRVVDILNGLFSSFDDLTDKYELEKIKTIGDAYMVAAGVPNAKDNHAHIMFQFAQEMLSALKDFNQQNDLDLNLRIGISSGPVVAGVIGKKKFAYDLWGDTVNTAARMEAYGKEGRIQVSPACYELLQKEYQFEKVSNIMVKGKGVMDVFLWSDS